MKRSKIEEKLANVLVREFVENYDNPDVWQYNDVEGCFMLQIEIKTPSIKIRKVVLRPFTNSITSPEFIITFSHTDAPMGDLPRTTVIPASQKVTQVAGLAKQTWEDRIYGGACQVIIDKLNSS